MSVNPNTQMYFYNTIIIYYSADESQDINTKGILNDYLKVKGSEKYVFDLILIIQYLIYDLFCVIRDFINIYQSFSI